MRSSSTQLIAREGWVFILVSALLLIVALRLANLWLIGLAGLLLTLFVLLFRDPPREIPSLPLAVVSPVDGRVTAVEYTDRGCLNREATRIVIRIDHLGAYSARSPVEGKVLNLRDNFSAGSRLTGLSGLWVRTDENDDIVVLIKTPRFLPRPRSFVNYGERLGQGQRFAFTRLATTVEVFIPLSARVEIKRGDYVFSGGTALGTLVHD